MFRICCILMVLTTLAVLPRFAQGEPLRTLTLAQAVTFAERNWLQRTEIVETEQYHQQRRREQWRRLFLPALTVQETTITGSLDPTVPPRQVEARLDYPLYAGGADWAAYQAEHQAAEADHFDVQNALRTRRLDVLNAYLYLVSSRQRIDSLQLAANQADVELRTVQHSGKPGSARDLQVVQARLALAEARHNLQDERRRNGELLQRLTDLIRVELAPDVELQTELQPDDRVQPLSYYEDWARQHHPALRKLQAALAQAREETRRMEATHYPELSLSVGMVDAEGESLTRSAGLTLFYRFGGHVVNVGRSYAHSNLVEIGYAFTDTGLVEIPSTVTEKTVTTTGGITFFDRNDAAADAGSMRFQARLAEAQAGRALVESRQSLLQAVKSQYDAVLSARERLSLAKLRVEKNALVLASYRADYKAGSVRYDDVLERQTALNRSRIDRINAGTDVVQAWYALLTSSGLPLDLAMQGGAGADLEPDTPR